MNTKIFATMGVFVLLASLGGVAANGVGNPDRECQANGFDFGIAKWEAGEAGFTLEDEIDGYDTNVEGSGKHANWTSNPAVAGVLSKEGQNTWKHPGGTEGEVTSTEYVDNKQKTKTHDISHLTFCGKYDEIPEFGGIVALAAVGLLGAGVVAFRRN